MEYQKSAAISNLKFNNNFTLLRYDIIDVVYHITYIIDDGRENILTKVTMGVIANGKCL